MALHKKFHDTIVMSMQTNKSKNVKKSSTNLKVAAVAGLSLLVFLFAWYILSHASAISNPPINLISHSVVHSPIIFTEPTLNLSQGWNGINYSLPNGQPLCSEVYSNGTVVVQLTIGAMRVYSASGALLGNVYPPNLGGGPNPQFFYDSGTNRWIYEVGEMPNTKVDISKTGNIFGQWNNYTIPSNGFDDYGQLTVSNNKIIISTDVWNISNTRDFKNSTIFIINKTKLINNNTLSYSKIIYPNFLFPQPPVANVLFTPGPALKLAV